MDKKRLNQSLVFLIILLVIGFGLRTVLLDQKTLGVDEQFQYDLTHKSLQGIFEAYQKEENPPFHSLSAWVFLTVFGDYYYVQVLSALAGVLTLIFLYGLTKELFTRKTALISVLLMTFLPLHIFYSQHTRSYSFLIMTATLFFYVLALFWKRPEKKTNWALLIISGALLMYTHYSGVFVVGITILWLLHEFWKKNISLRAFLIPSVLSIISFLPWIVNVQRHISTQSFVDYTHSVFSPFYIFYKFGNAADITYLLETLPLLLYSSILVNALFLYGVYSLVKKKQMIKHLSYIPLSLLVIGLVSIQITTFFWFRNFVFLLPLFVIPIAYALSQIRDKRLVYALLILILIGWLVTIGLYYSVVTMPGWNEYMGL